MSVDSRCRARRLQVALAFTSALTFALPATAEDEDRVAEVERQVEVIAEELDALRKAAAVPVAGDLKSQYGLGPGASKIYGKEKGLSLGGYGEVLFRGDVGDKDGGQDQFDALRAILYVGYKFTDRLLVNSELEFEHAGTGGGGSVSTEFLNLDFLYRDELNLRGGLLLIPMGFINEIHEPVFFYGSLRPITETRIIPTTFRENGLGIFGSIGDQLQYRMYAVNGLDATGFDEDGLRGGRQRGSRALADHWAFVGRVDWTPIPGAMLGGSVYTGNSGQNQNIANPVMGQPAISLPDTPTTIWEVHAQWKRRGLSVRGLWSQAHLGDTVALSQALGAVVAKRMVGGYAEAGFDILPFLFPDTKMSLEPFYRYEHVDTQDRVRSAAGVRDATQSTTFHTVGLHFKPHPQVVLKLDYRNADGDGGSAGEISDEVFAAFGYVF